MMYSRYHILLLGLFLLGGSLSAKNLNEHAISNERQWHDDFYLADEQLDWPSDEEDDFGEEASGAEGSGIEEGSAEGPMTVCRKVQEKIRKDHKGAYIPRCTTEGEFESLQCNYQNAECWCVTRNGDKIPNTVRRHPRKPDCDDIDRASALPTPSITEKSDESWENDIDIDQPTDSNDLGQGRPIDGEPNNKIDPVPGAEIIHATEDHGVGASASNPESEPMKASSIVGEPGILAGIIGGAVVGLLCAVLLVMFIVYRMRKKDEGSYALDEPKRSPPLGYTKARDREFFA